MANNYTIFISDIHLSTFTPSITRNFQNFLCNYHTIRADALYILGDLFEAWLGDDDQSKFTQAIKQSLYKISQYCPVYLMHGNRDFLIGQRFCEECNIQLISDPHIVKLYHQDTLLMHGDTMCTDDLVYQNARIKFKSVEFQSRVLSKPLWFRRLLGRYYRWKSLKHQKNLINEIMDVNQGAVNKAFAQYDVQLMIHGHTHRPGIQWVKVNQKFCKRVVLSDWHSKAHALVCYANGDQKLTFY